MDRARWRRHCPSRPPISDCLAKNTACLFPPRGWPALSNGRSAIRAHGNREMPVWGEKLYQLGAGEQGDTGVSEVIGKIVAYLNTIQDRRTAAR